MFGHLTDNHELILAVGVGDNEPGHNGDGRTHDGSDSSVGSICCMACHTKANQPLDNLGPVV